MLESQMTFTAGFLSSEYGEEEYFFATDLSTSDSDVDKEVEEQRWRFYEITVIFTGIIL